MTYVHPDDIVAHGHNCVLSYTFQNNTFTARVRSPKVSMDWDVVSTESHARQFRAFYPHQRTQGSFGVVVECVGWPEFRQLSAWLRTYAKRVLYIDPVTRALPPPMTVQIDSRDFLRSGFLTTGIGYGDHIGSMVFAPELTFVSVADPNDPIANILKLNQASAQDLRGVEQIQREWFYPGSTKYSAQSVQDEILYGVIQQIVDSHDDDPVTGAGDTNPDNPRQTTG